MNSVIINSILVSLIFILAKFIQHRMTKSEESLNGKIIVSETCLVFLASFIGDFIIKQLAQVDAFSDIFKLDQSGGSQTRAFTDTPKF